MPSNGKAPAGWSLVRLDNLATVNPDQWSDKTAPETMINYVELGGVEHMGATLSPTTLRFGDAPSRARRRAQQGDILVSTVRPYLRGFTRIKDEVLNLTVSTGYAVLRCTDRESGDFLYQHVLSDQFVSWLLPRMTGTNYPAVNSEDVASYPVLTPPPDIRSKIGQILSSIDDSIEATRAVIDQTRRLKSAVLQELLTRGFATAGTKRKQTKHLGRIPAHWQECHLGNLLAEPIRNGFSPISPNQVTGHWVTTLSCVSPIGFQPQGVKPADPLDANVQATVLKVGDILVSRSNTRDLVGLAGIYNGTPKPCSYSDLLMRVRVDRSLILNDFALLWLLSPRSRDYFSRTSRGTSGSMKKIDRAILERLPVSLPPLDEQARIVETNSRFLATLEANSEYLNRLEASKSALSQGLLTGKISVSIPAAKLAVSQGRDARKTRKD